MHQNSRKDFEIKTDHFIPARKPDQMSLKKQTCPLADFADFWAKIKESKTINEYLNLARELKKTVKHEGDDDTNWHVCYSPSRLGEKL